MKLKSLFLALVVLLVSVTPAWASDVKLGEEWTYRISGRTLTFQGGDIYNYSYSDSATMALALWASTKPRSAGGGTWYRLGWTKVSALSARTYYANYRKSTSYVRPRRSGKYYVTLALYEASGGKWVFRSALDWGSRRRF